MKDKENVKNIIIGAAALIIFALVLVLLARIQKEGEKNEDWRVEGQVVKREVVTRDDEENGTEKVYLIDCEDENGVVHTFELTDRALEGNIGAAQAFREIETGKAYRFKVGWHEKRVMEKPGYYPSIYGAASLVEFNLEVAGEKTEASLDMADASEKERDRGSAGAGQQPGSKEPTGAGDTTGSRETAEGPDTQGGRGTTAAPEASGSREMAAGADISDRLESATAQDKEEQESPAKLEIGGIKIEPVEETIDEELLESLEDRIKEDLEESIRVELAESFDVERKSLQKEIENLQERLR